jgi:hypothetical protein
MVLPHFPHPILVIKKQKKTKKTPLPSSKLSHTHPIPGPKIKKQRTLHKTHLCPLLPLVFSICEIKSFFFCINVTKISKK